MDLAVLFDRLKAGDKDVIKEYYHQYYWRLYQAAAGFLGDQSVAQDIVANAFGKLENNRQQMNDPGHVYRWLVVVVKNDAIGHFRKLKRQRVAEEEQRYFAADKDEDPTEAEKEYARTMDQIHRAVKRLPSGRRQIFEKIFYDGLTVRQISEQLNIKEGTVRNQKNLALEFIREEMDREKKFDFA
jgi:RNA polymerase sigma-70 factor, ECF subfamily